MSNATKVFPYIGTGERKHNDQEPTTLTTCNGRFRFNVGHVPKGEADRQVTHGPLVPGPWAYAFGLCTFISDSGSSADELDQAKAENRHLEVADGDLIEVAGNVYKVRYSGFHQEGEHLSLELVKDDFLDRVMLNLVSLADRYEQELEEKGKTSSLVSEVTALIKEFGERAEA